jgi:hypothetical protein
MVRAVVALLAVSAVVLRAGLPQDTRRDCVTIGRPQPNAVFTYDHVESNGKTTRVTQQWESITDRRSRLRKAGAGGPQLIVNEYRVIDDVVVLDKTSNLTPSGVELESTTFKPGIVFDPFGRACANGFWKIASVTASFSSRSVSHAVSTPSGMLRIMSLRERITTPAGTFETVRYVRTSESTDEYWKSLEHGVIVKHVGKLPSFSVTETLVSIRKQ